MSDNTKQIPMATNVIVPPVGPQSQAMVCPYCQNRINTEVISEPSMRTHLIALGLCMLLCIPCVCIPYCMDSCKNRRHLCPHCKAYLGTYKS